MQRKLARLRCDAAKETQRTDKKQRGVRVSGQGIFIEVKNVEAAAPSRKECNDHTQNEADIAYTVCEERLERCIGVLLLFPPMTDESKRTDPD